jgi:hypothetical protein
MPQRSGTFPLCATSISIRGIWSLNKYSDFFTALLLLSTICIFNYLKKIPVEEHAAGVSKVVDNDTDLIGKANLCRCSRFSHKIGHWGKGYRHRPFSFQDGILVSGVSLHEVPETSCFSDPTRRAGHSYILQAASEEE